MSVGHVHHHYEFKRVIVKNNHKNVNKNHANLIKTDKFLPKCEYFFGHKRKDDGQFSLNMAVIIIDLDYY